MKVNLFTDVFEEAEQQRVLQLQEILHKIEKAKPDLEDWYNQYDPDWKPIFRFINSDLKMYLFILAISLVLPAFLLILILMGGRIS